VRITPMISAAAVHREDVPPFDTQEVDTFLRISLDYEPPQGKLAAQGAAPALEDAPGPGGARECSRRRS